MLKEVIVKIGPKKIDIQKEVIVEILLNSKTTRLVMSLEFARKQGLKKIEIPIYVRNIDGFFNKERPIEYMVKVDIYYQGYRCYSTLGH